MVTRQGEMDANQTLMYFFSQDFPAVLEEGQEDLSQKWGNRDSIETGII